MRFVTLLLVFVLATSPAFAQGPSSIRKSVEHAALAAAEQSDTAPSHRAMFWSGLALGVAGATTAVLGLTAFRVEDRSTGNAPGPTFQACVAQKGDPVYADNQCDALKGRNSAMLWSGVALGAVGAVLMIRGVESHAELEPGTVRFLSRFRF
jgi:hypothetical protein